MYIPMKTATDYGINLQPEKLKAATQNEQNDVWLVANNRPIAAGQIFILNHDNFLPIRIKNSFRITSDHS